MKPKPASPAAPSPLSDDEFERLMHFLDSDPEQLTMPIEAVDGFFCAMIAGPGHVTPDEYLPVLFGREPGKLNVFPSQGQAREMTALLERYWYSIASELRATGEYAPTFDPPDHFGILGRAWCIGFVRGMFMRSDGWCELFAAPTSEDLAAIAVVAGVAGPGWPSRRICLEDTHELACRMAYVVGRTYRYFLAQRSGASAGALATRH
jgi:uncharacterized protein